ncbi:MAG: OmpA family protein [Flavobacteriales bacterium]|nr:OmpA family protein [Flavobacteriales bacterium]
MAALFSAITFTSCGEETPSAPENDQETTQTDQNTEQDSNGTENDPDASDADSREDMKPMSALDSLNLPAGSAQASIADWIENGSGSQVFILDQVPLDGGDSDELSAEGRAQLDALAAMMIAYPELKMEVQGHTAKAKNAVGAKAKKTLSGARALWVKTKISLRGVDGSQLTSSGYGDEQLLEGVDPEAAEQKRIAVMVSK